MRSQTATDANGAVAAMPPVRVRILREDLESGAAASGRTPKLILAGLCVAYLALFFYLTRHFGFFQDELYILLNRRWSGAGALLAPLNQHLFLVPLLIYRLLWDTVGIGVGSHWLYQVPAFAAHIACVTGLYTLAARRAGPWTALAPATLLLVMGAGHELELWAIGMADLIALAAGVWALVLLERGETRSDAWACLLIGICVASYSVGLFLAFAIALQLAITDRRRLWVAAVPIALYYVWYVRYGQDALDWSNIPLVPGYDLQVAGWGLAGLVGFSFPIDGGWPVVIGYLMLAAGAFWVVREIGRRRRVPMLAVTGAVAAIGFWTATALARAAMGQAGASRYAYPSAVFILLLVIGFMRPARLTRVSAAALAVAGIVIAGLGLRALTRYAQDRNSVDQPNMTALGAAEMTGAAGDRSYLPISVLSYVTLAAYQSLVHDLGSPAFSPSAIEREPVSQQSLADETIMAAEHIAVRRAAGAPGSGRCAFLSPGERGPLRLQVMSGNTVYFAAGRGYIGYLWLRRLVRSFGDVSSITLRGATWYVLRLPHDASRVPWQLQLGSGVPAHLTQAGDPLTACVVPE